MRSGEAEHLVTDVVVFADLPTLQRPLGAMGCTTAPRTSPADPGRCRLVHYVTLTERVRQLRHHFWTIFSCISQLQPTPHALPCSNMAVFYLVPRLISCRLVLAIRCYVQIGGPLQAKDPALRTAFAVDLQNYHYADSINVVAEYPAGGYRYGFVLRSDLDCFVAPPWGKYSDANGSAPTLITGLGFYDVTDGDPHNVQYQTIPRLKYIAKRLGLRIPRATNLGTAWGAPLVRQP